MADILTQAPAQHKQPSRKGKRAWRKNVDVTEVQQGLDTVRDEIIKGGIVAEKTADQLFVVDTAGDKAVADQQSTKKLLKADEILAVRSAVAGVDGRKRKVQEVADGSTVKRVKDDKYVTHKELQRLRSIADNAEDLALEHETAAYDPWAAAPPSKHAQLDFVRKPQPIREPRSLRQAPVALTASGKTVPALTKPEAGKSYNPLVEDWSAILQREGDAALEAEARRLDAEALMEEKEARAIQEAEMVDAADEDAWATDYETEWDGLSEGEQQVYTVKAQRRKTPAERNKIKARKEREARLVWEKKQKLRDQQELRIRQIAKELSAKDRARRNTAQTLDQSTSSDSEEEPALRRRRFGQIAVPDAPLEVVLPEELQDSLRRLKPEGNLMTDRYRTMLINGKMEVRRRRGQAKQRKVDRSEKWSYKDWKLK